MRPVFHKSDAGVKAHLNLAVLDYWIVSVTKCRLRLKDYPNVRWDEIMRIAQAQVVVTAEMDTEDGQKVTVRQSTEAEEELAACRHLQTFGSVTQSNRKSEIRGTPKTTSEKNAS